MGMENYKVIKRVGEGSFGKVYLARLTNADPAADHLVIKVLPLPREEKEREAVVREVSLLHGLHHPSLTRCLDGFVDNEKKLCIVMPFYAGGDLGDIIGKNCERGSKLPELVILEWLVQLTLALEHLHSHHVLHRDIKSDNVFLTKPGVKGKVAALLGDFGVARVLEHTNAEAKTMCGTPYYMSPELIKNEPYNNKSDIWALGCVLYEMLTLEVPFLASSMGELIQMVTKNEPPAIDHKYSSGLRTLAASMLKRDPEQRPSCQDILANPLIAPLAAAMVKRWADELPGVTEVDCSKDPVTFNVSGTTEGGKSVPLPTPMSEPDQEAATGLSVAMQGCRIGAPVTKKK